METLGGRYRLLEPLGQGGMALVFKAQDLLLERAVAVKVLRDHWAADAEFVSRFRQEARAAARLSHPNIVAIYDVGEDAGRHYIVMEYVEGSSLKEELVRGPLSPLRTVEVGVQVCAGLQYAHQKGIIHRDIKPHNILLRQSLAKIADFGIARALGAATQTQGGEVFGSPQYLSPEVARGDEATIASDIYSLGVLLYEASTGRPPFQGESSVATALKHIHETPVPPRMANSRVPPTLEAIILKALAKDPQQRFASAGQMGQALADCLARSQEETAALGAAPLAPAPLASSPTPLQATPPPHQKAKKTFPWSPVVASLALAAMIVGLTLMSPSLVRRYLAPAVGGIFPSRPPVATPPPSPAPLITPSSSPLPLVLVPVVTGLLSQDARGLIEGQGLTFQEASKEFSSDVPEGRVLRQRPLPGVSIAQGDVVTVTISLGPAIVRVPEVTGLTVAQAEARLRELGLRGALRETWHATVKAGVVFQQDPAPGASLAKEGQVTLTVSKGPERVTVPNVVGLPEERAQRAILQAGLRNFPWVNYQGHDVLPNEALVKVCIGCVLSTTPGPGEMVELGTEIRMAVRKD